jgi:hypothetical protein
MPNIIVRYGGRCFQHFEADTLKVQRLNESRRGSRGNCTSAKNGLSQNGDGSRQFGSTLCKRLQHVGIELLGRFGSKCIKGGGLELAPLLEQHCTLEKKGAVVFPFKKLSHERGAVRGI